MLIEVVGKSEFNAEKLFLCNWFEMCGYLVIDRKKVLDRPVTASTITIEDKEKIRLGKGYDRIVIEILDDLLISQEEEMLVSVLTYLM